MRIGIVTSQFYPAIGGAENYARHLCLELTRLGCNVKVFTTDPSRSLPLKETIQGYSVFRFPSHDPLKSGWCFSKGIFRTLQNISELDIIHCHKIDSFSTLAAAYIAPQKKIPLIITPHLGLRPDRKWMHKLYFPTAVRWSVKRAQMICPVAENEISRLTNLKVLKGNERIEITPVGAPNDLFKLPCPRINLNPDRKVTVLFVGRLESSQKGLDRLSKIISASNEDIIFKIVGGGRDEQKIRDLEEQFPHKVSYLGILYDQNLYNIYAQANAFILPSRLESNPIVLVEAMAAGLPVIGSNIPSIAAKISDGFNGLLVSDPEDINEWKHKLSILTDNSVLSKMAINARSSVLGNSWQSIAKYHIELYESLLNN